jgi:hypothetical protein
LRRTVESVVIPSVQSVTPIHPVSSGVRKAYFWNGESLWNFFQRSVLVVRQELILMVHIYGMVIIILIVVAYPIALRPENTIRDGDYSPS